MTRAHRSLALAAALTLLGAASSAAGPSLPRITPAGIASPGLFTLTLHGAGLPLEPPSVIDAAAIVKIAGVLDVPSGFVRYPRPVPGAVDLVVAQHDPRTVWVVAHLSKPPAGIALTPRQDALVIALTPPPQEAPARRAQPTPRAPEPTALTFSVRWSRVPLGDAARTLARLAGVPIRVEPSLAPTLISLATDDATLADLLAALAQQAHAHVAWDGAGYSIAPGP
jgi:hypothetical protein